MALDSSKSESSKASGSPSGQSIKFDAVWDDQRVDDQYKASMLSGIITKASVSRSSLNLLPIEQQRAESWPKGVQPWMMKVMKTRFSSSARHVQPKACLASPAYLSSTACKDAIENCGYSQRHLDSIKLT